MHRGSSTVNKIKAHWAEFRKLRERLEEIASFAIPLGVAISIEWPRGCRYWTNHNVVRFLGKYGFKFADFDGCMYGLVAAHGKCAGLPIKKPWRVAYVNSSLGEFLHLKCDGSHEHSPCSGRNTSDTERYTPKIAKAVHQCFGRDARQNRMNCSDDAITIMPAAISVLKLPESDKRDSWADLTMAKSPPLKDNSTEWPDLGVGAASKPTPRPRKWSRSRPPGVVEGGALEQELDEEAREQKLDVAKEGSPNADHPLEKTGPDQKVVMGLAGQWRALENARFVPQQGDRRQLMYDINSIAERDIGALYEWLKNVIISCRFIVPGQDSFREIKLKTIAMLRKMLDPDGVCGVNVAETASYRDLAKHCSSLFANVAGELIRMSVGRGGQRPENLLRIY